MLQRSFCVCCVIVPKSGCLSMAQSGSALHRPDPRTETEEKTGTEEPWQDHI